MEIIANYKDVIALCLLAATFGAFMFERWPPAVVAVTSAAIFLLLGLVDTRDVTNAFANSAPITIAAMLIMSGALVRTGVLHGASSVIVTHAERKPRGTLFGFLLGASTASAFVNNTPVVAVLIPVAIRLSRALRVSPSRLLIPLSYASIVGGTCTLIGTSTNLLVDGMAQSAGIRPFTIFEITPVGIVTALTGLVTMMLIAPYLLPNRTSTGKLTDDVDAVRYLADLRIAKTSPLIGKPLSAVRALQRPGVSLLAVLRGQRRIYPTSDDTVLEPGDVLSVLATLPELLSLEADGDFTFAGAGKNSGEVTMEAILAPSGSEAHVLYPWELRLERFGVSLIGLSRHGSSAGLHLASAYLRPADRLLLRGKPEALVGAAEQLDLINLTEPRARSYRRRKAPVAILAITLVVLLAALDVMPLVGLAWVAIAALLIFRCIDADEAWQSLDANILLLIVAMLIIGTGLERSGGVELVVSAVEPLLLQNSPFVALVVMYFVAVLLTEVITNNAVAVVLTPIAIGIAGSLDVDPRQFVFAVMFGASACFATPIGYQTNTMVYGAGDYRFTDFLKIGIPMNIIVGIATCLAIHMFVPLR